MRNLFLSTVAAIAIAATPAVVTAQSAGGGSQKEMSGAGGAGGERAGSGPGGGERSGAEGGGARSGGAGGGSSGRMDSGGGGSRQDAGGAERPGGGSGEMRSGGGSEMKSGGGMEEKSGSGAGKTRDSDMTSGDRERGGADRERGGDRKRAGGDRERGMDRERGADRDRGGDRDKASGGARSKTKVNVTSEQRTKIKTTIRGSAGGARVSKADLGGVSVSVGVRVPRERVKISRVPASVVEIVPEYADYLYFVTDDDMIVIVDPDTYEIVYVL